MGKFYLSLCYWVTARLRGDTGDSNKKEAPS